MQGIFMRLLWGIGFALLLSAAGCGEPVIATVTGNITLDGQPLNEGLIRFVAADAQSASADANIKNGRYTAQVPAGEKRVEITAPKVIGKKKMYNTPDSPEVDEVEELLPPQFNVQTKLKATVKAGENQASFQVTSE
jgi:hypothetical protein